MTTPILTTKLYHPSPRPDYLPRPRLIEQLNTGLSRKFTLISAPAGFGKTTLVSSWINQAERPVAWLSLDESDNDLNRFLKYFIAALQTVEKNFGHGVLVALQSSTAGNLEVILTALINEIAEFPEDVILIFDDYHVIEFQPIDQAIVFLLEHLPSKFHLVVSSRIDPSWPLARLRARGSMTEIRANDLRFTIDEATRFLNQIIKIEFSPKDITALRERTEGWIAGLQLAAISLQRMEKPSEISAFINRFTGSDRYIQDYLAGEVLNQCPERTRDFLLQTAILRRMCASLCDSLTGLSNSQTILNELDTANLFIVPLDNDRNWYRYHHLFADLLLQRLKNRFSDQIQDFHIRASHWFQKEGLIDEAIYHSQEAGDIEKVVGILERNWQVIIHRGEMTKLKRHLDTLGPDITGKSPPLSMAYCWIHNLNGAIDLIPKHLDDIREIWEESDQTGDFQQPMQLAVIPSLMETMQALVELHNKQFQKAKEHALLAVEIIPDDPNPVTRRLLYGVAGYRLAEAHIKLGEYEEASSILLTILEMLKTSQNYIGVANTIHQIVTIYQQLGKIQAAIHLCEDAIEFIAQNQWEDIPPSGIVYLIYADLLVDAGNRNAARENFQIGQRLIGQMKSPLIEHMLAQVNKKLETTTPVAQQLVEPLSKRESEVLQLVALGLTNLEISKRLYLAVDTVKGHNRNSFAKLGAHNRTEAVARARELGLL